MNCSLTIACRGRNIPPKPTFRVLSFESCNLNNHYSSYFPFWRSHHRFKNSPLLIRNMIFSSIQEKCGIPAQAWQYGASAKSTSLLGTFVLSGSIMFETSMDEDCATTFLRRQQCVGINRSQSKATATEG